MDNIMTYFDPWTWFIISGVLLFLELLASGIFFMFLGIAAAAVGIINLVVPMSWQMDLTVFSILSVALIIVARPIVVKRLKKETDQPNLNKRNVQFVGKTYYLEEPIKSGKGSLNINDTRWRVRGTDAPKGTQVRVTDVDGLELIVVPVTD